MSAANQNRVGRAELLQNRAHRLRRSVTQFSVSLYNDDAFTTDSPNYLFAGTSDAAASKARTARARSFPALLRPSSTGVPVNDTFAAAAAAGYDVTSARPSVRKPVPCRSRSAAGVRDRRNAIPPRVRRSDSEQRC